MMVSPMKREHDKLIAKCERDIRAMYRRNVRRQLRAQFGPVTCFLITLDWVIMDLCRRYPRGCKVAYLLVLGTLLYVCSRHTHGYTVPQHLVRPLT